MFNVGSIRATAFTTLLIFAPVLMAEVSTHEQLVSLFDDWREFETPPMLNGAPDYTAATMKTRHASLSRYQQRLGAIDISQAPIAVRADWHILRAEMNGFDFNHRILKPWVRDPAFYKSTWTARSDVPAHEGPTHHALTELWTYDFPLSASEEARLVSDLSVIAPLNQQAQQNLTGNARELWIAGIRDIRGQQSALEALKLKTSNGSAQLKDAISEALLATDGLIAFLEKQAPNKTGPSGIGKENYTWYQQNVHLVPLTWEDEVRLLKRELDRAWSSLKLEEHRNRGLPSMVAASSEAEFSALADRAATSLMNFLEDKEIVTVRRYFDAALREQLGSYVPEETRNFFYIGSHFDPRPLYSHFYHWFELAIMDNDPHADPIRRGALLYNIFDSRNEGTATAVEEMFMQAGLYRDSPRSREIVWIMIAQRAARGLGSLYAHANEMTMDQAGQIHMEYTPRGWMKTEPELRLFEQHLYLRQPGYGTSYITGKYLLERTLADYGKMKEEQGEEFKLKDFFDELNSIGGIPISLGRWQMTGLDDEIKMLLDKQ